MQVFIISFTIFTLLHPLGDFLLPRRFHHFFFFCTNPLHLAYDLSPLRQHQHYHTERDEYWRWLGVDQTMHVIINLFLSFILELIIYNYN